MVVKPPSCIRLVGAPPKAPAVDTAPAPAVDVGAAARLVERLRADGYQVGDVAAIAVILDAALARIRDLEDPTWVAYRIEGEAWIARVVRTCR